MVESTRKLGYVLPRRRYTFTCCSKPERLAHQEVGKQRDAGAATLVLETIGRDNRLVMSIVELTPNTDQKGIKTMKKKLLTTAIAGLFISGTAAAQGVSPGATGITATINDTAPNPFEMGSAAAGQNVQIPAAPVVRGKFFMGSDFAILAGGAISTLSGDVSGSILNFQGGVRKYFSTGDFAPFAGGGLSFTTYTPDQGDAWNALEISGEFGAEYFFSSQFSIDAALRAGLTNADAGGTSATSFGTLGTQINANYYF